MFVNVILPCECVQGGSIYLATNVDVHRGGEPAGRRHDRDPAVPRHRPRPRLPLDRVDGQAAHRFQLLLL